jgi:hypothetical protein
MLELEGRARTPRPEITSAARSHPGKGERQVSILIDMPAALVASPRPCALVDGARLLADDAQPRVMSRSAMPVVDTTWRQSNESFKRGFETAQRNQDGRTAFAGAAYVTTKHHSIRSGPPTSRPPA